MIEVPFLDLRGQTAEIRGSIDEAIARVLDRGVFVLGEEVEAFEREFADYCGAGHCVGVGSGTDAISIALRAAGIGAGDEVIAPANTCVPTIAGIERAEAVPVLADVDGRTLTLDPASVESAVATKTRAIVAVHLYGLCADMPSLRAIADRHGLVLVEDAAQAHGAAIHGVRAGALGDVAAFSFYPTKNLGALGDGGAVVTNDAAIAQRARRLRVYGESERYLSEESGWNSRLDELQAAILRAKLERLDDWNNARRDQANVYSECLEGATGVRVQATPPGYRHALHLYVIRLRDRELIRSGLAGEGIQTLVHYPRAVHHQPAFSTLRRAWGGSAEAELACDEVLSLPLHPGLVPTDVARVAEVLRRNLSASAMSD